MGGGFSQGYAGHESRVYSPNGRASYFSDLINVSRGTADYQARQRLATYDQEFRDLNRADGTGGQFVPPTYLVDEFIGLPRPGRVTADLLTRRPLPPGTDVLNIPKIATGTATAIQPQDNDPVQETDATDATISAPVRTIAGQQDVAVQLLDQSPVNFDDIIAADLMASYNQQLGNQVLSGAGTSGTLTGLRSVPSIESVTWTSATPTVLELQKRVADAVQRIATALYEPPNAIIMAPRRWAWLTMQVDSSNRPMIVPEAYGPTNAPGVAAGGITAEGRVGSFAGLPVFIDSQVPVNVSTNQDLILVLNTKESILWESTPRVRVLPEVLSGTLTVRIQLYNYVALATRQAKSIAVISGTGLVTPTST
jgi:HK97 family phage major capsid protein